MKHFLTLTLAALLGALVARAEPTRAELVTRIESCEAVLQELQGKPAKEAWQRAKAVLILNQFRAGFLIGVKDGYGVIMVKKADGRWSLPVLVNAGEASLGLQLGASAVESVFIITDDQVPRRLFTNRFNVGVDAKAVAGPHASQSEATNVEILRTPLLAYTKSTGLFAGATVKAGHISRNDSANYTLYDTRYTLPELLYSDWVTPPKEVQPLMALMQKLAP
ncbi:MAG: lipid-binding SYLF domain-containing protein [Opitutaceae bacterium]|nr:lipid-binding SYLF domain-containing protein [Opitutaceae bacterium]